MVRVWWESPRWRGRRSAAERRGATTTRQPSAAAVWAESSATNPPCPSAVPDPMMPGPGADAAACQWRAANPCWSAPRW